MQARNLRFEQYLEEILRLGLSREETHSEIVRFVAVMEAYYNKKVRTLLNKLQDKKKVVVQPEPIMENELKSILMDAID